MSFYDQFESTTIIGITVAVVTIVVTLILWYWFYLQDNNSQDEHPSLNEDEEDVPLVDEAEPIVPDAADESPINWCISLLEQGPIKLQLHKRRAPNLDDGDFKGNVEDFVQTFQTLCYQNGEASREAIKPLWEFLENRYTTLTVDTPKQEMRWDRLQRPDEPDEPYLALWVSWNELVEVIPEHDKDLKYKIKEKVMPLLRRQAIDITTGCVTIKTYLEEDENPQVLEAVKCQLLSNDKTVREVGNLITDSLVTKVKTTMDFDSLNTKSKTMVSESLASMSKLTDFHLLGTVQSLQEESSDFKVHICTFCSLKPRSQPQRQTTTYISLDLPKNIKDAIERRERIKKSTAAQTLREAKKIYLGLSKVPEDVRRKDKSEAHADLYGHEMLSLADYRLRRGGDEEMTPQLCEVHTEYPIILSCGKCQILRCEKCEETDDCPSNDDSTTVDRPPAALKHAKTIPTLDECYTVTLNPDDGQEWDGGRQYDSLNGAQDNIMVNCIRAVPGDHLMMLKNDWETSIAKLVVYSRTSMLERISGMFTLKPKYREESVIKVDNECINSFTKLAGSIILTGANAGKVYLYALSSGDLCREVSHPDLCCPFGICNDGKAGIYITDIKLHSLFSLTLKDTSITKLDYEVAYPTGIAVHDNRLIVLSDMKPVPKLHIVTIKGDPVTIIDLPECRGSSVRDICVIPNGVVAIANGKKGVQVYEFFSADPGDERKSVDAVTSETTDVQERGELSSNEDFKPTRGKDKDECEKIANSDADTLSSYPDSDDSSYLAASNESDSDDSDDSLDEDYIDAIERYILEQGGEPTMILPWKGKSVQVYGKFKNLNKDKMALEGFIPSTWKIDVHPPSEEPSITLLCDSQKLIDSTSQFQVQLFRAIDGTENMESISSVLSSVILEDRSLGRYYSMFPFHLFRNEEELCNVVPELRRFDCLWDQGRDDIDRKSILKDFLSEVNKLLSGRNLILRIRSTALGENSLHIEALVGANFDVTISKSDYGNSEELLMDSIIARLSKGDIKHIRRNPGKDHSFDLLLNGIDEGSNRHAVLSVTAINSRKQLVVWKDNLKAETNTPSKFSAGNIQFKKKDIKWKARYLPDTRRHYKPSLCYSVLSKTRLFHPGHSGLPLYRFTGEWEAVAFLHGCFNLPNIRDEETGEVEDWDMYVFSTISSQLVGAVMDRNCPPSIRSSLSLLNGKCISSDLTANGYVRASHAEYA